MMEADFAAVPQVEQSSSSEEITNSAYEKARTDGLKIDNMDKIVLTCLKGGLALFIACLIISWFCFMKDVVLDYINHFHSEGKSPPEATILAIVTLGSTVMGGMTYILKGLFGTK